jgi:diguanylate cyclase (GGDEF)-like protein
LAPGGKKAARNAPSAELNPGAEPELASALLELYRQLELPEQFRVLLDRAVEWAGAVAGFVFGKAEEGRGLRPLMTSIPEEDPRYRVLHTLEAEQISSWVEDTPVRTYDGLGPLVGLAPFRAGPAVGASVAFALQSDSERLGVLWLQLRERPDPGTTARVERLLHEARPGLDNALQVRSMRELIIKDDTARCFNRRYFEEFLPEELARASRFRAPLSLIFFDLDNLKGVNNAHGHAMGSRVLAEVSLRVRGKIRKFDKLFRFGGDEFCIVLPETEWRGALEVAERVREAIASRPFLTRGTGLPEGVRITASFGVAAFPFHARTKQDLIAQADKAMQRIKGRRKNAVGVSEETEHEQGRGAEGSGS